MNKRLILFYGGVTLVAIFALILGFFINTRQQVIPQPQASPTLPPETPTPTFDYSPTYKQQSSQINAQQEPILQQGATVHRFEKSLPYLGKNISVSYSIDTGKVTLVLRTGFEAVGNTEFDTLLQKYGIKDRGWLGQDLEIQNQPY